MITIISVRLQDFRGIESAEITLSRGLNVLHGANETGKSTFVAAIRAAFLLPYTSSEGKTYVTWGTDRVPQVEVTFETEGTTYRIAKAFSTGSAGHAKLFRLKGNEPFEEANCRGVDGKLRRLLAWGIPEPGGRGAPRGLPESYLTHALLGKQDDVTSILTANIDEDPSESGKTLLTQALGAMGQAPLIATLIEQLEERTGRVFTPTGQQKRSADSPLVERTREIEKFQRRIDRFEQECHESEEVEERIERLREEVAKAEQAQSQAKERFDAIASASSLKEQLTKVQTQQEQIESQRQLVEQLQTAATEAISQHKAAQAFHDKLEKTVSDARARCATAEQVKARLEQSIGRSKQEREEAINAKIRDADRLIEKGEEVVRTETELAERAQEVARAESAKSEAGAEVTLAEKQLRYAQLLAQRQAQNLHPAA